MNLHLIQDTVFLNDFADLLSEMGEIGNHHFYVYYSDSKDKNKHKYLIPEKFKNTKVLTCSLEDLHLEAGKYKNVFIHLLSDMLFDFVEKVDPKVNLIWCTWGSDFCSPDELFGHETLDPLTLNYFNDRVNKKLISEIEVHKVPFSYRFLYDYVREKYRHSLRVKHAIALHKKACDDYLEQKKIILKRFNYLVNYGEDDYEFIEHYYGIKHVYQPFFYTVFTETDNQIGTADFLSKLGVKPSIPKIFIGNCATIHNNHLDMIPALKKIKSEYPDVAFIVPLSYGDKEYTQFIANEYKKELGNNFYPIYDFIEKDEYYRLLNSIDVMLMNHNRNQGGTNLFKAIYFGKKIFLKNKNPLAKHLRISGVQMFDIENDLLKQIKSLFVPIDQSVVENNKKAINSVFSKEMAISGFRNILNTIDSGKGKKS